MLLFSFIFFFAATLIFFYIARKYQGNINLPKSDNNIVIVLGKNYPCERIKTFFITLKRETTNTFLLIFGDNYTIQCAEEIYKNSKKLIGIEILDVYPYYPSSHKIYPIPEHYLHKHIPTYMRPGFAYFYHTIRFFLTSVWINKYGNKFDWFLLCDIKDILFQSDPFSFFNKSGLYFQEEVYEGGFVGVNYDWIKPYHPSKDILRNPIINIGQILGSYIEFKLFFSKFCAFINRTQVFTAEQATFNYFIYTNRYKGNYITQKYGYGYALLLFQCLLFTKNKCFPENNYFFNLDKSLPPIIHGYDLGLSLGSEYRKRKFKDFINFHNQHK